MTEISRERLDAMSMTLDIVKPRLEALEALIKRYKNLHGDSCTCSVCKDARVLLSKSQSK